MPTIDVENVVALLGRELTAAEARRAVTLLDIAEGVIGDVLPGFSIATGNEEATLDSWVLPRYPVTVVNELSVNGSVVDPSRFTVTPKGEIRWLSRQLSSFEWNLTWPCPFSVVADYDFGLDPPPYSVVHEVANAVAVVLRRQSTNPDGVMSETVDGYSVSYGTAEQAAFAAGLFVNVDGLKRWKRNRQVSVPLVK